jgi:hypothetical protein
MDMRTRDRLAALGASLVMGVLSPGGTALATTATPANHGVAAAPAAGPHQWDHRWDRRHDWDHRDWRGRDWDHRGWGWSWEQQCDWAWHHDRDWWFRYCS